jgi:hypothetical protein
LRIVVVFVDATAADVVVVVAAEAGIEGGPALV